MTRLEFTVPVKELYPDIHVVLALDTVSREGGAELDLFFVNLLAKAVSETLKELLDNMIEAHALLEKQKEAEVDGASPPDAPAEASA